jgi:competence protein ComEA
VISSRTGALVVILFAIAGAGVVAALGGGGSDDAFDCAPSDMRWVDGGTTLMVRCMPGAPPGDPPAAQAITAGVKLDLNRLTVAELTLVPGIGDELARAIVAKRERLGGFRSWDEVDGVRGVGPAKVKVLQALTELRP